MSTTEDLKAAVEAALAGKWERAHGIVQQHEDDATACWIHAILHKIEGDAANSRYWYARSEGHAYDDEPDATAELRSVRARLTG